jgi:anthranilate phosphoribosyltransferase
MRDQEQTLRRLTEVVCRVTAQRCELAATVYAIRAKRRTPEEIRMLLDSARRAVYLSRLLRHKWAVLCRVQLALGACECARLFS